MWIVCNFFSLLFSSFFFGYSLFFFNSSVSSGELKAHCLFINEMRVKIFASTNLISKFCKLYQTINDSFGLSLLLFQICILQFKGRKLLLEIVCNIFFYWRREKKNNNNKQNVQSAPWILRKTRGCFISRLLIGVYTKK